MLWHCLDVLVVGAGVAKKMAYSVDRLAKIILLNGGVGPNGFKQFLFCHKPAAVAHKLHEC